MPDDFYNPSDDNTLPSRRALNDAADGGRVTQRLARGVRAESSPGESQTREAPWALHQYLNGQIDLDRELSQRYPAMPVMSQIHVRGYGERAKHGLATVATQDSAAALHVEVDGHTRGVQFTFVLNAMLGLKFIPARLSDRDRAHWLDAMRRAHSDPKSGEALFLWGASRWESDYLICAPHKHFTNVYAFSPLHVEAAARLTSDVMGKLLEWLDGFWRPAPDEPRAPKLNTW